jgi:hypothetical protein
MKGTATNKLGYTGIVTISQYNQGKKILIEQIHNEGNYPLFNFLANCLIGAFDIAKLDRPAKIMLLNKTESGISAATNAGFLGLRTNPEKVYSATSGIVRYSFIIPAEDISTDFNAIGLYMNSATKSDLDNYAACCDVDINANTISSSSVLVIDWELHITNGIGDK